ncbi:hypothetical protein BJX70DRAFT_311362 [Aspergillus crustosus]
MDMYWDSSDAEDQPRRDNIKQQPAARGGLDAVSEERECTEIDEDELVNRIEDGSPGAEGLAALGHSVIEALSDTAMSDVLEGSRRRPLVGIGHHGLCLLMALMAYLMAYAYSWPTPTMALMAYAY